MTTALHWLPAPGGVRFRARGPVAGGTDHQASGSTRWPVETSGSPPLSHARSASAGTTRLIRASGTTPSGCSCANTAVGAGATPHTGKPAELPDGAVARNRKRAKERRSRRPQPASQPGLATARADRDDHDAPDPIAHAAPDVELAEAQMALGRPASPPDSEPEIGAAEELEPADELEPELSGGRGGDGNGGLVPSEAAHPARAAPHGDRPGHFLQGGWRE